MSPFRILSLGTALVAALFVGSAVQADVVYFATVEFTYDNGGGPVTEAFYDNGQGAVINFQTSPNNTVQVFPDQVTIGSFLTQGTQNLTSVSADVRLTILQQEPFVDAVTLVFDGVLTGMLGEAGGTTAYIQFNTLTRVTSDGSTTVSYDIINGADGFQGRVAIASPDAGGTSTVNARVNMNAIPEPSAIALLGLAAPAVLAFSLRRRHAA